MPLVLENNSLRIYCGDEPTTQHTKHVENYTNLTAGGGEFESPEANIVQGLVVKNHTLISILNKLMNRQGSVVRLNHSVRDLRGMEDREREHHALT